MGESKKYNVPSAEFQDNTIGWCGGRLLVKITIFISLIIYLTGSIITGIAYRVYEGLPVNCTMDARFDSTHIYVYETPFVVVGPCFMSAGGAVLTFLLLQWVFCRPTLEN
ncbi:hypothetical protein Hamer_G005087 [Homarus americanus]|uniref:Uncharacterized protein n=1 Tax=Homarus americanus TaxID=6706 RepID=A0A8J5MV25_HOMAM|nr:hypothetical protein Hamer_G005087 [Homarus americanus]